MLTNRRKYAYSFFIFLIVVRSLVIPLFFPQYTASQRAVMALLGFLFTVVVFEGIEWINHRLNQKMPFEIGGPKRLIIQIAICLVFTFLLHTFTILALKDLLPTEFNKLVLVVSYFTDFTLVVAINLGYFGAYFFEQWKLYLVKAERLEKENALVQKERAQVQFLNLQNQLNPHFLFNSLSSLNGLIQENPGVATEFVNQLSKVFRYLLENKDKELVPLETELQFITRYTHLLKTRFGAGLQVSINLNEEYKSRLIVPVTLQILLENAVKHNVMNEENPLLVQITATHEYLQVENNLNKKNIAEHSRGVGLINLKTLYQYLSPLPLQVVENEKSFWVKIPLL
jgi:sensor histidine kinase YesM